MASKASSTAAGSSSNNGVGYYQYEAGSISEETKALLKDKPRIKPHESTVLNRGSSLNRSFQPFAVSQDEDEDDDNDDDDDDHHGRGGTSGSRKKLLRAVTMIRPDEQLTPSTVGLYFVAFLVAITLCYVIIALTQSFTCLGAPYLYLTHQGSRNIMKFSRDGCLLHEKVLWGLTNDLHSNLRSMIFGTYDGKEALYVADADSEKSGVMIFGSCFDSTSLRPLVKRVASSTNFPGAQHTYGIAIDSNGDLYASFQKTDAVLRFKAQSFEAIPPAADAKPFFIPKFKNDTIVVTRRSLSHQLRRRLQSNNQADSNEGLMGSKKNNESVPKLPEPSNESFALFDGSFVQFGRPEIHNEKEQGIRSILWVKNSTELWIANEDINQVIIVNREGQYIGNIIMSSPIGLYASDDRPQVVYIGSKGKKIGSVYAINIHSHKVLKTFQSIGMKHPTGITSYHDVLYVGDQTRNAVLAFNITTSRVIKMVIPSTKIKGDIEQLAISQC